MKNSPKVSVRAEASTVHSPTGCYAEIACVRQIYWLICLFQCTVFKYQIPIPIIKYPKDKPVSVDSEVNDKSSLVEALVEALVDVVVEVVVGLLVGVLVEVVVGVLAGALVGALVVGALVDVVVEVVVVVMAE